MLRLGIRKDLEKQKFNKSLKAKQIEAKQTLKTEAIVDSVLLFLSIKDIGNAGNVCFLWFKFTQSQSFWSQYNKLLSPNPNFNCHKFQRVALLMNHSPSRFFCKLNHAVMARYREKMEKIFSDNLQSGATIDWRMQMQHFKKALQQEKFVRAYQEKLITDQFLADPYLFNFLTVSENMIGQMKLLPHTVVIGEIFAGCAFELLRDKVLNQTDLLRVCDMLEYPHIVHLFRNEKLARLVLMSEKYFEIYKQISESSLDNVDEKSFQRIVESTQDGNSPRDAISIILSECKSFGIECSVM